METAKIAAIATAVPPHRVEQETIERLAPIVFGPAFADFDRLMPVFANTQVKTRYFSQPLDWYLKPHSFSEANTAYEKTAFELTEETARGAMSQAGVRPQDIGLVMFVSTTGFATPSLDSKLIQTLGLPQNTRRLPVWGLGCAAGAAGLARAADLAAGLSGRYVLLVAVELCSLTFQINDPSKANVVATSLFADGAAALLVGPEGDGPEVIDSHSHLFEDSADIMGWDLMDSGLRVRLSRDLPSLVRQKMPQVLCDSVRHWGITAEQIRQYVIHPGGAKLLRAFAEIASVEEESLEASYHVLRNYGNMSSPSVLFGLKRLIETRPPSGDLGLLLAFGPGFSAEQLLFRW